MTTGRTARELSDWLGYLSGVEVDCLQALAGNIPQDGIVVAIGAGAGTHTLSILEVTEDVVIFSVDIACAEDPINTNEHLRLTETFSANGLPFSETGHVIRIWGDSKIVGKRWPLSVDFLFIDGDHSEPGVIGDIQEWMRHVKPGGVVAFHDYGSNNWPAVKQTVDRLVAGDLECIAHEDTLIAFRKSDEPQPFVIDRDQLLNGS